MVARIFDLILEFLQVLHVFFFLNEYSCVDEIVTALFGDKFQVETVHFLQDRSLVSELELGAPVYDSFPVQFQDGLLSSTALDLPMQAMLHTEHIAVPLNRPRFKLLERRVLHYEFFDNLVRLAHLNFAHTSQCMAEHATTEHNRALDQHIRDPLPYSIQLANVFLSILLTQLEATIRNQLPLGLFSTSLPDRQRFLIHHFQEEALESASHFVLQPLLVVSCLDYFSPMINRFANLHNDCHSDPFTRSVPDLVLFRQNLIALHHHIFLDHHSIRLVIFILIVSAVLSQFAHLLVSHPFLAHSYLILPFLQQLLLRLKGVYLVLVLELFVPLLALLVIGQFAELGQFPHLIVLLHQGVKLAYDATFGAISALYLPQHGLDAQARFLGTELIIGVL